METIRKDKTVTLRYAMKTHLPDGSVQDNRDEQITFIYGIEPQIPTLDKALKGKSAGDRMSLRVPAVEIYGAHDPALVREIPQKGLIKQRLKEGRFYRQMKGGSLVSFKVLEVRPETVLADFNRPLAGISVTLDLEVLAIKDAEKGEIEAAREAQIKRGIGCG